MAPLRITPALLACLSIASAFPSVRSFVERQEIDPGLTPFDAAKQYISNKGAHKFIAPGPNDSRSPCPALNALANHGYIPRDGYASVLDIERALPQVYGTSLDVASFLGVILLGSSQKRGDTNAIGGFPAEETGFGPLQYQGLHLIGTVEGPAPVKQYCDGYKATNGSAYVTEDYVSTLSVPLDVLMFRVMGNKSAAFPEGSFSTSSQYDFLAMSPNGDGTFAWNKFHNRIPNKWYTRNILSPYSAASIGQDTVNIFENGGYDSMNFNYDRYDMSLLTNGAYTNKDLKDSTTNLCFLTQAAAIVAPALAQSSVVSASTRSNIASAISDFQKATTSLPCSSHVMKSMNLAMLGKILGIAAL